MEFEDFKEGYNSFCLNWQRKGSEEHARFLYRKISDLPAAAWKDIVEEALVSLDRFPRTKDLFGLWYGWRKRHSHTLIEDAPEETDCMWCLGTGLLEYRYEDDELKREHDGVACCGYCQNWKKHFSPKRWKETKTYKVEQIAEMGWKWTSPPAPCTKDEAVEAIDRALDSLGTSMKEYRSRDQNWKFRQDNYEEEDIPF